LNTNLTLNHWRNSMSMELGYEDDYRTGAGVYILQGHGCIKAGVSRNISKRFRSIKREGYAGTRNWTLVQRIYIPCDYLKEADTDMLKALRPYQVAAKHYNGNRAREVYSLSEDQAYHLVRKATDYYSVAPDQQSPHYWIDNPVTGGETRYEKDKRLKQEAELLAREEARRVDALRKVTRKQLIAEESWVQRAKRNAEALIAPLFFLAFASLLTPTHWAYTVALVVATFTAVELEQRGFHALERQVNHAMEDT
jgi:hypothetical protein